MNTTKPTTPKPAGGTRPAPEIPAIHFTQHEGGGTYSVIMQGQPLTIPQKLATARAYVRRCFPDCASLPCWSADEGRFLACNITIGDDHE